jgi:hypothetical protein
MRLRRLVFVGAFLGLVVAAGAFGACTLNPQPLPPEAFSDQNGDAASADSGAGSTFSPGADAATVPAPSDANGGGDGGDASDDGGDASDDASYDAG